MAWFPTMATTPFATGIFMVARRSPASVADFASTLMSDFVLSILFGLPAAMFAVLIWPLTRRVIVWTSRAASMRLLYGFLIGLAAGLIVFIANEILMAQPVEYERVQTDWPVRFVSMFESMIGPAAATGLIWALWFVLLDRWMRRDRETV